MYWGEFPSEVGMFKDVTSVPYPRMESTITLSGDCLEQRDATPRIFTVLLCGILSPVTSIDVLRTLCC